MELKDIIRIEFYYGKDSQKSFDYNWRIYLADAYIGDIHLAELNKNESVIHRHLGKNDELNCTEIGDIASDKVRENIPKIRARSVRNKLLRLMSEMDLMNVTEDTQHIYSSLQDIFDDI